MKSYGPDRLISQVNRHSLQRLRRIGVLHPERDEAFRALTCGQLYDQWIANGAVLRDLSPEETLREAKFVRRVCGCTDRPPIPQMVALAHSMTGSDRLSIISLQPFVGELSREQLVEVAQVLNLKCSSSNASSKSGDLTDVLALFPTRMRDPILRRLKDAQRDGAEMPTSLDLGRLLDLPERSLVITAAEVFRISSAKGVRKSITTALKAAEILRDLGVDGKGPEEMEILSDYLFNPNRTTSIGSRQRTLARYARTLRSGREWLLNVCQCSADELADLLPAHDPRHPLFEGARQFIKARSNASPDERDDIVAEHVEKDPAVRRAVRNRLAQVQDIYLADAEARSTHAEALRNGQPVSYEVIGRPIRADGTAGDGSQAIRFRLQRADCVLAEAVSGCRDATSRSFMRNWLKKELSLHPLSEMPILTLYDGVRVIEGRTAHEPHFVDFYRWAVFDPRGSLAPERVHERLKLLKKQGLTGDLALPFGLIRSERLEQQFARVLLLPGNDPAPIAFCPASLLHGLLYATLVYAVSEDNGARSLEIQQIRLNANAIRVERRDDEEVPFLYLRPKGVRGLKGYQVEPETADLVADVADFTARRWLGYDGEGRLSLPTRKLGSADGNRPLPHAEYLFVTPTRTCTHHELIVLLRALLWDLSKEKIHDRRYGKVTRMAYEEAPQRLLEREANHERRSPITKNYNRSVKARGATDARRFNANRSAALPPLTHGEPA